MNYNNNNLREPKKFSRLYGREELPYRHQVQKPAMQKFSTNKTLDKMFQFPANVLPKKSVHYWITC